MFYKRTKQARTSRLVYNSTQKRNHIGIVPDVKAVKGGERRTDGRKQICLQARLSIPCLPRDHRKKNRFSAGEASPVAANR